MAVTMKDIARQLRVSESTVSRVLNRGGSDLISEATRDRVLTAARELGYTPNRSARALATGRTHVIALAIPDMHSRFFTWIAESVVNQLRTSGYDLILAADPYPEPTDKVAEASTCPVDGVIAWGATWSSGRFADLLHKYRVPLVGLGLVPIPGCDCVYIALAPAVRDAIRSLISSGRKHIGYLAYSILGLERDLRASIYHEIIAEAGLERHRISPARYDKALAFSTVQEYIAGHPEIDAIFCSNDNTALVAIAAVHGMGKRVPEDIAIIGCDGIEDGEYSFPSLSTVVQPVDEMVRLACECLLNRLENPESMPRQIELTAKFVRKGSS